MRVAAAGFHTTSLAGMRGPRFGIGVGRRSEPVGVGGEARPDGGDVERRPGARVVEDLAPHDGQDHVGGARGVDEGDARVVDRERMQSVQRDGAQVRILAGRERAGDVVEAERARAAERGQLDQRGRGQRGRLAAAGALEELRGAGLFEQVLAVVARDGIRSEPDADARAEEPRERCDAVGEARVRDGAVRDRGAGGRDARGVVVVDIDAVDEERLLPQQAEAVDQLDGGAAAGGQAMPRRRRPSAKGPVPLRTRSPSARDSAMWSAIGSASARANAATAR